MNIASLAFLSEGQGNHHHLAIGNELGSVRRYDTRASKQPVADWVGISKVGGVRRIEKGSREQYVLAMFTLEWPLTKATASYSPPIRPLICYAWTSGTAGSSMGTKVRELKPPLLVLMACRSVWFHWLTLNSGKQCLYAGFDVIGPILPTT